MLPTNENRGWNSRTVALVAVVLAVWAGLAYVVGATELAMAPGSQAFRPIGLTAAFPVAAFFLTYAASPRLRAFVSARDIRSLTALQHWRVVGFGFLLLYAHDALPAAFAIPAGVGDVLIGLTTPLIVARLARDRAFARSGRFVAFHLLGLFDFVVAVTAATLTAGAFPGVVGGGLTSAAMEVWPLNLFPSFIVPAFIILHVVVLMKVRALRRAAAAPRGTALRTA